MSKTSEQDVRKQTLIKQLEILSQGLGAWRENIHRFMLEKTPDLAACWKIGEAADDHSARKIAHDKLWEYCNNLVKQPEPIFEDDDRKEVFKYSFSMGFNIAKERQAAYLGRIS